MQSEFDQTLYKENSTSKFLKESELAISDSDSESDESDPQQLLGAKYNKVS